MKLVNGDKAIVPYEKLGGYALNPNHPKDGSDKARVFRSVLGVTLEQEDLLRNKLLEVAASSEDAVFKGQTIILGEYMGDRNEIRFRMQGPNGNSAEIISAWFFRAGEDIPRLNTCYINM